MVLVTSHAYSTWEMTIRKRVLAMGIPCGFSTIREAHKMGTPDCIVVQTADFDALRHEPMDHIPALILGKGFVNSALGGEKIQDEELEAHIREKVFTRHAIHPQKYRGMEGWILAKDFYVTPWYITWRNQLLPIQHREYRALLAILYAGGNALTDAQITAYTFIPPYPKNLTSSITTLISSVNKKCAETIYHHVIARKSREGYRLAVTPLPLHKRWEILEKRRKNESLVK